MAYAPIKGTLTNGGATLTVPSDKVYILSAFPDTANAQSALQIVVSGGGTYLIAILLGMGTAGGGLGGVTQHPICAGPGDVISCIGGSGFGYSGLSFDVGVAFTPFNFACTAAGATYTVPNGKLAIFTAFAGASAGTSAVTIDGTAVASLAGLGAGGGFGGVARHPLSAGAAQVIGCTAGISIGLSGLLLAT